MIPGRLLTRRYSTSSSGAWTDQLLPNLTAVTSVKFSPNYISDQTLAVVYFGPNATLSLGKCAMPPAAIQWDVLGGYPTYPMLLGNTLLHPITYLADNITRTGIQLPSDYTAGSDMSLSGCFVNIASSR